MVIKRKADELKRNLPVLRRSRKNVKEGGGFKAFIRGLESSPG